jgi:four helix bundle protein
MRTDYNPRKIMTHNFKKLDVWVRGMDLVRVVYALTKTLPLEEKYALGDQLRRAAVSIPSNIAEGSRRGSKKDFAQFIRIALGSLAEVETQLLVVEMLYKINTDSAQRAVSELHQKLEGFLKRILTAE